MIQSVQPALAYISYEDFQRDVHGIMAAVRGNGWMPDFIVGLGRGGLAPAVYVSHGLNVPMLSVDHSSKVADFSDELLAKLAGLTVGGSKLLFVDDINDSGSTLLYIRNMLEHYGADTGNVRIAVLINNIRSRTTVDYWSREIDRDTHKDWFVFPWEAMASVDTLVEEANEVPERLA